MQAATAIRILETVRTEVARQAPSLLLWVPVCLGLGIIFYFQLKVEPPLWSAVLGLGVWAGLSLLIWRGEPEADRRRALLSGVFLIGLIALGFGLAQGRTERVYTPMLAKALGPVFVEGTVVALEPKEKGQGSRVILKDLKIEKLAPEDTPRRIRLLLRDDKDIQAGDRVKGLARLNAPSGPVRPGAFDFQRHAFFQGLGAVGFFFRPPEILDSQPSQLSYIFEYMRSHIVGDVRDHVARPYDAVVIALLTGQRQGIRDEDKEAMRESGLAHLLAISGLHVGMVAGAVFFFLRLALAAIPSIALNYPIKKWAAAAALIGAAYYTFVVGAAIPAQRALMMTGLVLIAIMVDRSPFSLRLVAIAASVILLLTPEALMGVSFQMSFAAVVCLIAFYEWARPWWSAMYSRAGISRRVFMYFLGVTATTVIAGFATGLFALYHFQQFASYSVLSNIIAVPIVGFIVMPAAVAYYLLTLIGLEGPALNVMEWGVGWVLATAHWTANLEGAVLRVAAWPPAAFALIVAGSLFMILWAGRGKWLGLLPVLIGLVLIPLHHQPDILIGEDVKLIGVKAQESNMLSLSSRRAARYTAENWMRLSGLEGQKPDIWPRSGRDEISGLNCDPQGCRLERAGVLISFPRSETIIDEECLWADLVIAPFPVSQESCKESYIYDLFDAKRNGTASVFLNANNFSFITDRGKRGQRLWTRYALQ